MLPDRVLSMFPSLVRLLHFLVPSRGETEGMRGAAAQIMQ